MWAKDWVLVSVRVCTSTHLAGAAAETDPAVDGSILNISDVIIHDRNQKMSRSEINLDVSFLSYFFAIRYIVSKWLTAKKRFGFFKKKRNKNKSFTEVTEHS